MIKIIMLTGFLGSGKTTLLKSLLESYKTQKVAVIVNEFGEINVDGQLLKAEGVQMTQLTNGSIFCACIKDKFVDSLIDMSALDADVLFIEASGLADPANMGQILNGIKVKTKDNYELLGSVSIVDAVTFTDMVEVLPALQNQVEYANAAIINKSDLVEPSKIEETEKLIHEFNEEIKLFVTSYCNVDVDELVDSFVDIKKESGDTTNTVESRPSTFVVKAQRKVSRVELENFIHAIAPDSYRIKGFVKTENGDVEVSAVIDQLEISDWNEEVEETQLVVISAVGIKMLSNIIKASKECASNAFKI